jgi:hypothetical protein
LLGAVRYTGGTEQEDGGPVAVMNRLDRRRVPLPLKLGGVDVDQEQQVMCLDRRAMRSYRAVLGWQRRKAREAEHVAKTPPFEGGSMLTRAGGEGVKGSDNGRDDRYAASGISLKH